MIIKRLTLHNFGVYASDNTFDFNNKKSVVLIGGLNGRGKTTFLEAVLLALYGSNSFSVQESTYSSYGNYLRAHTNLSDNTMVSFVELEFTIEEDNELNTYTVNRSWDASSTRIRDHVLVKKNGIEDSFLTENWTMFVESILPSALSNFYFFDGEKIAELANNDSNEQMKSSIRSLLGINIIDLLENDLSRVIRKIKNEKQDDYSGINVEELRHIRDEKKMVLEQIDKEISEKNGLLRKLEKDITKKKDEFNAKGGLIADQSKELYAERLRLKAQLDQINQGYLDLASGELPLIMNCNLLCSILEQSKIEKESQEMKTAISKFNALLEQYSVEMKKSPKKISDFIDYVKSKAKSTEIKTVFNLSDISYAQLIVLIENKLKTAQNKYLSNIKSEKSISKRISEIDNYLAVDIDEKAIQRIYKKICELETRKTELEVEISNLEKKRTPANGEYMAAEQKFNKCVDLVISTMEQGEDNDRIVSYAMLAQSVAKKYQQKLQESKIERLANTITSCYKNILIKKNFIDKVEMDPITLDYKYLDCNGNEILKNTISAGEKQLMIISILWALAECSGKMLPVIIDTPLARLDSKHRKTLIEQYFPNASSQTIILSTDSEIDDRYYKVIKPYVSDEFTLIYDEVNKCSHIKKGYFEEFNKHGN